MGSYNRDDQQADSIPMYSNRCSKHGCKRETSISLIKCSSGDGISLRAASDVLANGTQKPWIMRDGFNFLQWITRCAECYYVGIRDHNSKLEMQERGDI
jgi:hypothetical protein